MKRLGTWLAAGVFAALPGGPGWAAELELGLEAGVGFDDNVLASDENEESDFFLRLGPRISVHDKAGEFRWQVYYRPRYDKYLDLGDLDGWDHNAYASVAWDLSRATSIELSDRYLDYDNFTSVVSDEVLPDGSLDTGVEFGRQRFRQNAATASLVHRLGPLDQLNFGVNRYDSRFQRDIVTKTEVTVLYADYLHRIRPQDQIGLQLRGTRQEISDEIRDPRKTDFYNVSGIWEHQFDPTFGFQVYAGPTWVDADEVELPEQILEVRFPLLRREDGSLGHVQTSTCPRLDDGSFFLGAGCQPFPASVFPFVLPPQLVVLGRLGDQRQDDSDLTYFASVSVSKRWRTVTLTLNYLRDASTTADRSGSVRDNVSATLNWRPGRRWNVTLRSYYETREQLGQGVATATILQPVTVLGVPDFGESIGFQVVEVENDLEVKGYFAGVYATYALSRSTRLVGSMTWQSQKTEHAVFDRSLDRLRVFIGVIYTLPAFELPI